MEPTNEDLRVAITVVRQCVERAKRVQCDCEDLWCKHWMDKVAAEFASALAAEREKAAKGDINSALAELREMFPNRCINITVSQGIAAGFQVTIHLINPDANGTAWGDRRFSQPTLAEAMTTVREYYDDGHEADIDARQAALGQY